MSKIHIRVGNLEIDFEGEEKFIKNDLLVILEKINSIYKIEDGVAEPVAPTPKVVQKTRPPIRQLTTNSIATRMNVKTGPDLAIAACAHLRFIKNMKTFDRSDILREMKSATGFYKENYIKNLSHSLRTLLGTKLNEVSKGKYALKAETERELEGIFA